jgi:uncharacterized membrane protein
MNRAFFIILIPVLLVAMGYVAVFRIMGIAPGYPRLIVVLAIFLGVTYWFSRRNAGKRSASGQ